MVRIEAWPKGSPNAVVRSAWKTTGAAHVAKIEIGGVGAPGDAIAWRPQVRGALGHVVDGAVSSLPGRPPPGRASRFTFAFGCCILQGEPVPALDVARTAQPVFFAMLGDLGYQDNPVFHPNVQDYRGYSKLFRRMLSKRELAALLGRTPLFAVQDDHDYGKDGCWRGTIEPFTARAFEELVPGAAWPGPNYRAWSIGEADFFLTDNRRYKDPPGGPFENGTYMSVLGATQRAWLLSALAASTAPVKIVFIPMTMTWYWSDGEANEVLDFIRSNVGGRVIFLSGDKHAAAFVHHPGDIWEMLAAPLENPQKHLTPARPNVVWTENGTGRALSNVVGLVDVDTLDARTITLRLMREDGQELHREVLPLVTQP
jgi:PhoD-like phosphatase